MNIPNPVIYVVGDVLGTWYHNHTKLDTLFGGSGFPGDPPSGNCVSKCQMWLRKANAAPAIDPIGSLGKVLAEFMSLGLHDIPDWQPGFEKINRTLGDCGLMFHEGKVVPIEARKRFRVALSFPGERRPFVEQIAEYLAGRVGRDQVLYDKYCEAELARPDLDTYLPNLYRIQSELVAIFLSADYTRKRWCKLEWRFIRQMISTSDAHRIMFLSFDDIGAAPEIGILSGDGYVSVGSRTPEEIAGLILERLEVNAAVPGAGPSLLASVGPAPEATGAANVSPVLSALTAWRKKLAFLQAEEAKLADPEQKFAIQQRIEEAKEKIHELDVEAPLFPKRRD